MATARSTRLATPADPPALPSDGRARRSARSRAAIEAALFALVGEGVLQPTAQEVAARAGVALRSVFRHFSDIDSLFASLDARVRAEALPLVREPRLHDPLPTRVRDLVRQRAVLFDRIAPYKRSADLYRGRSAFVRSQQSLLVRELRVRLLRWLPELAKADPDRLEAVDLAMSFEAWVRLRSDQRLSRARAITIVERTVTALLASHGS
jgi:AcrR family transcriptional regulator